MAFRFVEISTKDLLTIIISVSGFLVAFYLYNKNKNNYQKTKYIPKTVPRKIEETNEQLRKKLLNMVLGDHAVVNRLIQAERSLRPNWSEKELIQLAIDRLIRDRR